MIYTLRLVTGILSLLLSSTIAQQSCYWPDGTGVNQSMGEYINCYADHDSHCCSKEDVCLSNGLCYGSVMGMVRQVHLFGTSEQMASALTGIAQNVV